MLLTLTTACTAAAQVRPASVSISDRGAAITSNDGAYELRIRAVVQTDLRFFADDEHKLTDQFLFRRARLYVEGKVARVVTFRVMPDFAEGRTVLYDAWFDVRANDALRLRVGKAKPPFALERLQNDAAIVFGERAYPTALAPNRDLGVELHGDLWTGILGYSVGVFNGVPDNGISEGDLDDSKEVAARVEVGPFARTREKAARGLRLGFAITRGEKTGTATSPYLAGYRTFGQNTLFSYLQDTAAGAPAAGTSVAAGLHDSAWNATASLLVTGEDAAFDGPILTRPFDVDQGHIGAVEIAVRATELHLDGRAFSQLADPTKSARDAFEVAAGLNWYPMAQLKIVADFARTTFLSGAVRGARDVENVALFRTQLAF